MKKLLLLCAFCFVFSSFGYTMTDFDTAKYLADNGIITPQTTATKYRLDDKILRQEVIGMALKMKGVSLPDNYTCKKYFADATKNDWVCRAVEFAADNGIITRSNKYANPGKYITRAEALAMVMKAGGIAIQEIGVSEGFAYYDKNGKIAENWQSDVLETARTLGIIKPPFTTEIHSVGGNPDLEQTYFKYYGKHDDLATRAEVFGFAKNTLTDGGVTETKTAYINSITGNIITLDYFDIFSGEEAKKMMVADGKCTQEQLLDESICFPNGVNYLRNINPKLRTFTLASDIVITVTDFKDDQYGTKNITIQELKKNYSNGYPFRITFNEQGDINTLEEIFVP